MAALDAGDTALLAKLATGDMLAIEAKYHQNCLRSLYNRARHGGTQGQWWNGILPAWHSIYWASGILGSDTGHHHHDQRPGVQAALLKDVKALVTVLEDMGNNFLKMQPRPTGCWHEGHPSRWNCEKNWDHWEWVVHQVCNGTVRRFYNTCHTNSSKEQVPTVQQATSQD